uniref:Uncharacterized protein n=1 Tax=Lepeophtheirus salmonis TaxID=72036 RepID=A0A0K2TA67_LEPSM
MISMILHINGLVQLFCTLYYYVGLSTYDVSIDTNTNSRH